jgi:hypothetical protein
MVFMVLKSEGIGGGTPSQSGCGLPEANLPGNRMRGCSRAFSSEVDTGSREENASKQQAGASVLIQSEPKGFRARKSPFPGLSYGA